MSSVWCVSLSVGAKRVAFGSEGERPLLCLAASHGAAPGAARMAGKRDGGGEGEGEGPKEGGGECLMAY